MPKVLLVDDEQGGLRGSVPALEEAGFEVNVVTVARAALKLVETRLYTVIGCEFDLGEMQGIDFLNKSALAAPGAGLLLIATSEQMRASKESKEAPATPVSRRPSSEARVPGLRVLIRPFETEQLVSTVQHLARMAEMRRSTHAMASAFSVPDDESPTSRAPAGDARRSETSGGRSETSGGRSETSGGDARRGETSGGDARRGESSASDRPPPRSMFPRK